LCWYYYGKKFITQVNEVTKGNKIGKKKAKGIIYDKMLEDLSILHKKRSEETGLQLPEITRKYLQGKTQKAVKIYNLFEKVGVDKIKYITTYTANAISELTNDKLQEIIEALERRDNFSEQKPKELHHMSLKDESSIPEISEKILPEVNASTTPMPAEDVSVKRLNGNSSDDSSRIDLVAVSTSPVPQVISSNQSQLPISILPEDPEEK
jgi:hypothetical protein